MIRVPLLGSKFSPRQLPGLVRWLDASDLVTLFQDSARTTAVGNDSDPVGGATDKSGQGNHFIQATAGKRPSYKTAILNNLPALRFDGVDDSLQSTEAAHAVRTTFIVAKRQGAFATSGAFLAYSNIGARLIDTSTQFGYTTNEAATTENLGGLPSNASIVTLNFASTASCVVRINGAQTDSFDPSDGYSTGTILALGSRPDSAVAMNCDVFETIDCAASLSTLDMQKTERYLATKFGISI